MGVIHLLGMDTHDARSLIVGGPSSRNGTRGWCLPIEPGIYIPANDQTAPKELRGIGIRIEDDVLVTKDGVEVLTIEAPKIGCGSRGDRWSSLTQMRNKRHQVPLSKKLSKILYS